MVSWIFDSPPTKFSNSLLFSLAHDQTFLFAVIRLGGSISNKKYHVKNQKLAYFFILKIQSDFLLGIDLSKKSKWIKRLKNYRIDFMGSKPPKQSLIPFIPLSFPPTALYFLPEKLPGSLNYKNMNQNSTFFFKNFISYIDSIICKR